jgi:hypothetical protein
MSGKSTLTRFADWYLRHCNGDEEHRLGFRIVLLAAASFALASCETTQVVYVWSKSGVTQSQFERDKLDCLNEVIDVLKVGGLRDYASIQIECMKRKGYTYQRQHLKPSEARKLSSN